MLTIILVATLASPQPIPHARSSNRTGIQVLRECEGRDPTLGKTGEATCMAYLMGVLDGHLMTAALDESAARRVCLPAGGITHEQVLLVVTKWLKDHPEKLHEEARVWVYIALMEAFPCLSK